MSHKLVARAVNRRDTVLGWLPSRIALAGEVLIARLRHQRIKCSKGIPGTPGHDYGLLQSQRSYGGGAGPAGASSAALQRHV
jgi:hypothetical protein